MSSYFGFIYHASESLGNKNYSKSVFDYLLEKFVFIHYTKQRQIQIDETQYILYNNSKQEEKDEKEKIFFNLNSLPQEDPISILNFGLNLENQ